LFEVDRASLERINVETTYIIYVNLIQLIEIIYYFFSIIVVDIDSTKQFYL